MAITDLYNIVHDMTLQGQNVLNVYQAERTSGIEAAATISDGFQTSVLPSIRALQHASVVNNELRIFNLGTSTDFGTFTLGGAVGLRAGAPSPSFLAGELRFPSRDRAIRNGYKRYRGIIEEDYTAGLLLAPAIALLDAIGAALIGDWLSSIDSHAVGNFIIVKRVCDTTPPEGEPCPAYRLPEPPEVPQFYTPNMVSTVLSARSQVSSRVAAS